MRIPHINITKADDLEALRRAVEASINRIIDHLNANKIVTDVDMQNFRVRNLQYPASQRDAVNVEYLQQELQKLYKRVYSHLHEGLDNNLPPDGGGESTTVTLDGEEVTY